VRRVLAIDRGTNLRYRRTSVEEGHGVPTHVKADRAADAVSIPLGDSAVGRSGLHKTIVVPVVTNALASAVARDVLEDLRMSGGELVYLPDEGHGPRRCKGDRWECWKRAGVCLHRRNPARRRLRSRRMCVLAGADARREEQDDPDKAPGCGPRNAIQHEDMVADSRPGRQG